MASLFSRVRPGDLITASLFNLIYDELESLEQRLAALGVGGTTDQLSITGIIPAGPVRVGDEIRILGTGFGTATLNVVTFDGVLVNQIKPASSSTQLVVDVPALAGVPSTGKNVGLFVSNQKGTVSATLTVLPFAPVIPTGTVAITPKGGGGAILPPATVDYKFAVTVISTLAETYDVAASITAWSVVLLDDTSAPVSAINLPAGVPPGGVTTNLIARVTVPTGATGSAVLTFSFTSRSNPTKLADKRTVTLTVNAAPPAAQAITVKFAGFVIPPGSTEPGPPIRAVIPAGTKIQVPFSLILPETTDYVVTTSFADATGWSAPSTNLANFSGTANQSKTINALVTANSSGAAVTKLKLHVEKKGDATVFGEDSVDIRPA
jgi:hypothetical protein